MAYTIAYGDPVVFTGTLTITPIAHGDTATPVATPVREVRSTVEMTYKQIEKYLTTATLNAWRDESGKYIQVERT